MRDEVETQVASIVEWEVGRDADGWWVRNVLDLDGERLENISSVATPEMFARRPGHRVAVARLPGGFRCVLGNVISMGAAA